MPEIARYVAAPAVRFADVDASGRWRLFLADLDSEAPQLWLQADDAPPRRMSDHADAVAFAAFRPGPEPRQIVYGIDRGGDENQQLHLIDLAGEVRRELTAAPSARHVFGAFSPDGGALAYTTNADNGGDMDVVVAALDGTTTRRVLRGHGLRRVEAWSPCGRFLAVVDEHAALAETLHVLDLETGAVRPVLGAGTPTVTASVRFLPDGDLILVTDAGRDRTGVARIARADGGLRWLLTPEVDVEKLALAKDKRRLAVLLNHQGYSAIEVHDHAGGKTLAIPVDGLAANLAWQPDGTGLLATVETARTPARPWRFDPSSGEAAPLAAFAPPAALGSTPSLVHVPSFDGRRLPAFLYPPAPGTPVAAAPAVMCVHGGPESQWRPGYHGEAAALAAQGWTVLAPNLRGSTGYGRHYAGLDDRALRPDVLRDLGCLGRWLAARDDVDAARVALMGQSYGGFVTLAGLAHQPELWRAGVDLYGMADLATFLRDTAPYRRNHRAAEYGDPITDATLFAELSPLRREACIRAPLLVVHGLQDPRVAPFESRQMAQALRRRGQPVEHLEIAEEGHGFVKRANRIAVYGRIVAFLVAQLAD